MKQFKILTIFILFQSCMTMDLIRDVPKYKKVEVDYKDTSSIRIQSASIRANQIQVISFSNETSLITPKQLVNEKENEIVSAIVFPDANKVFSINKPISLYADTSYFTVQYMNDSPYYSKKYCKDYNDYCKVDICKEGFSLFSCIFKELKAEISEIYYGKESLLFVTPQQNGFFCGGPNIDSCHYFDQTKIKAVLSKKMYPEENFTEAPSFPIYKSTIISIKTVDMEGKELTETVFLLKGTEIAGKDVYKISKNYPKRSEEYDYSKIANLLFIPFTIVYDIFSPLLCLFYFSRCISPHGG